MSEIPPQSSNRFAENVLLVVGVFIGFFIGFYGLISLPVMWFIAIVSSISKDPFNFALLVATPVLLAGIVIYVIIVIITKKPKGFILGLLLGLLIGMGFAFLSLSLCALSALGL